MEMITISIDGDHACALLGVNLQEGEAEFMKINQFEHEPLSQAMIRAGNGARALLEKRLGKQFQVYYDISHPYGG